MNFFKSVRVHISITVAVVIVVFICLIVGKRDISLIFLIFASGSIGGIINSYMRVKNIPLEMHALGEDATTNKIAILQVYVSPIVSGGFGIVFYVLCLTNIVGGDLFPNFSGTDTVYENVLQMFKKVKPKTNLDANKALIWAFIAGFSERLVPNVLDSAIKKTKP